MVDADVPAVVIIETKFSIEPWSEKLYCDCIRVGYSCWVLEQDKEVIGFGLLSCAVGEAHILNLVIDDKWQRQGLGRRMMQHLIDIAKELQAHVVYLEVRKSNLIAQNLYKNLQFIETGLRKDYYPALIGREDGITFTLQLK